MVEPITLFGIPIGLSLGEWYMQHREVIQQVPAITLGKILFSPFEWTYQMGLATKEKVSEIIPTYTDIKARTLGTIDLATKAITELPKSLIPTFELPKIEIPQISTMFEIPQVQFPQLKLEIPQQIPTIIQVPTAQAVQSNLPLYLAIIAGLGLIAYGVAK